MLWVGRGTQGTPALFPRAARRPLLSRRRDISQIPVGVGPSGTFTKADASPQGFHPGPAPCTQRAAPWQHRGRLPPPPPWFLAHRVPQLHGPSEKLQHSHLTASPSLPHQEEVLFRAGSSFRLSTRLGWERERREQEALPSWFAQCISPSTYTVRLA